MHRNEQSINDSKCVSDTKGVVRVYFQTATGGRRRAGTSCTGWQDSAGVLRTCNPRASFTGA